MTVNPKATRQNPSFAGLLKRAACGLFGLLLLPGCSTDYLTDGVVTITIGQEPDAWSQEPAAKDLQLEMIQGTTRTTLANVAAPVTNISIGTGGPQSAIASFDATAFDSGGNVVMKGSTVPLGIVGFEQAVIPLFMGRVGGLSRAPGDLLYPHHHPQVAILYHGYLLISGGDEGQADLDVYDAAHWGVAPQQKPLPKVPESWAISGPALLLVDQAGATWLDMSTLVSTEVTPPVGLHFADIVGGETIGDPGDPQYIVGGTRTTGDATNVVLRIDPAVDPKILPDARLHLMKLGTPRLGASAAIVNGQLLVVGGADSGAGAEISNATGTGFTPLPFPADATQGAALVAQDETTAVLAGGRDPASDEIAGFRTLDLACAEDCAPAPIENVDFAFDYPRLFAVRAGQLLAVGEDPTSGETHVFTFDTGIGHAMNEFALRVPRARATALMLPNGQVGVLGGDALADESAATSLEVFIPQP